MAEAELELEAMKMDDCSWHPCQVYFSPNGASLVVQYESDGSQDILVSEKEALMRIRVRSLPLQEDGCTQIKPGEHVVVNQNSESETGFFDAEVEKVLRVRHSKRMDCRCSFMIRWLHQDLNGGSLTVPSTSVMRLADRSIDKHPTISVFIDANSTFSGMSPELNVVDDFDLDLQNLLEKQIEGIKNSVHCSKKRIRDEINGLEANAHEQENKTDISLPNVGEPEIKFSTGSPLNPLAARAALASLMSKPQGIEISTGIDNIPTITKLFLKTEPAPKPVRNVKKSLFSTNDSSDVSHVVEVSSAVVVSQSGKGHAKADKMNPEITTRSTCAKSQKAKCFPDENVERSSCVDRKKPSTGTNRRLTRSVLHQEAVSIDTETKEESAGDELPTERRNKKRNTEGMSLFSTNDSSEMSPVVEVSSVVVNQSGKGHAKEDEMNPEITTGLTRAKIQKDEGFPDEKFERSNCVDSKKSSTVTNRRFTRSVLHQEAASIKTETKKESGGEVLPTEQRSKKRNTEGISLFSTKNTSEMTQVVEVSSAVEVNQSGKRHAKADKMNPEITTGLTRAESQKAHGVTDEKFERRNGVDSKKPSTVTNMRFTRSVLHQEAASIATETKEESAGDELPINQSNKRNTEGMSLFSTNNSSEMSPVVEVSSVVVVNQSGKGHAKEDEMNPEITTELTRAKSQKDEGFPDEKFERSNCVDSKKSSTVTNRRFTRSVLHQEAASIKTETKKESGGEELPTEQRSKKRNTEGMSLFSTRNSSEMTQVVEVSSAVVVNQSGKRHAKADTMNPEITTGLTRAESQKAHGVTDEKFERSNCVDGKKPSTVTNMRFTRSVLHQEAASIDTETKKESAGDELSTELRNKKRNTEGNGGSSYGNKKNSLDLTKHKVLRSSPRFNSKS